MRPKTVAKRTTICFSEEAWKILYGKGSNISKLVNERIIKSEAVPLEIVFNECKRYMGVDRENPSLIICKNPDNDRKALCYPKEECRTCKYLKDNEVILKSIATLEKEQEHLQKSNPQLRETKANLETEIKHLREEYQSVNVPDLEASMTAAQKVVVEKNMEISRLKEDLKLLQTENERLKEHVQLTKIEPRFERPTEPGEKPLLCPMSEEPFNPDVCKRCCQSSYLTWYKCEALKYYQKTGKVTVKE